MDSQKDVDLQDVLGIKRESMSILSEEISDEELMGPPRDDTWPGMKLLFVGLKRFKVEGGPSDKPMEVWFAVDRSPTSGRFVFRSIRGRSHLAGKLRTQVLDAGMVYVNAETGEQTFTPGELGAWGLVSRKEGTPMFLYASVAIDKRSGAAANKGRRFAYNVRSAGVVQADASARIEKAIGEALPVGDVKLLTVDETAHAVEGEAVAARDVDGKASASAKKKR